MSSVFKPFYLAVSDSECEEDAADVIQHHVVGLGEPVHKLVEEENKVQKKRVLRVLVDHVICPVDPDHVIVNAVEVCT